MAGENRKMTFEAALSRLEEIVRSMENGNAMLDESLTLFEVLHQGAGRGGAKGENPSKGG